MPMATTTRLRSTRKKKLGRSAYATSYTPLNAFCDALATASPDHTASRMPTTRAVTLPLIALTWTPAAVAEGEVSVVTNGRYLLRAAITDDCSRGSFGLTKPTTVTSTSSNGKTDRNA